jgi:pyrimidine operon attenuation protein/uracil phosphoribosyltransferase
VCLPYDAAHSRVSVPEIAGRVLLDEADLQRTLRRIAHEIVEKHPDIDRLALVGIHTRGVYLADRLAALIEQFSDARVPTGALDISFYRDDVRAPQPVVKATRLVPDRRPLGGARG